MHGPYDVEITETASVKLDEIHAHVARVSPQNAASLLGHLIDAIFSLKLLPQRYKIYRRGKTVRGHVRSMPVPPFVIY